MLYSTLTGSYEEIIKTLEATPKWKLDKLIIDEYYNNFLKSYADYEEGDANYSETGKRIPYIGWFWRDVEFSKPMEIPIGDCEGFIGFMVKNKWDYPERYLTLEESTKVIQIIDEAIVLSKQGGMLDKIMKDVDNKLQELWVYMQTLTVERTEEYV